MKGQAINIDWTVGLTLFLFTSLSSIFLIGSADFGSAENLRNLGSEIQNDLEDETSAQAFRSKVKSQKNRGIENVPVDQTYYTEDVKDWTSGKPLYINSSQNRLVTVINSGENLDFTFYGENVTARNYSSDLSTGSDWINNSKISVKTGSAGVEKIIRDGESFFREISLNGFPSSENSDLFAESFSRSLTVYRNSSEITVKQKDVSITLNNYSTIYWEQDSSSENLGSGYSREEKTEGFAVADGSKGIAFTGKMNAEVVKTGSEVEIDINSSKIRIRPHDKGISYGEERVNTYSSGNTFIGVRERVKLATQSRLETLDNMTEAEFENLLNLEEIGYEIKIIGSKEFLSKGSSPPPLTDAVVLDRTTPILTENGTIQNVEVSVGVWQ